MSDDWKTLRVPVDKYEQAKDQKENDGRTWGEQIVNSDDEPVAEISPTVEFDGVDELLDELKRVRELVERNPDRTADELEGRFGGHP